MGSDDLAALQAIDLATLTQVVRIDQRSPTFEITDWAVAPISHEKVIDTTGGIFRFSGLGQDQGAATPWTVVLKAINRPTDGCLHPNDWCYWKRELLAFECDALAGLPRSLVAPRCYGATERDEGGWIWMEHIEEIGGPRWTLDHFHRAARAVGGFGGAFLGGVPPLNHPWLSAPFFRSIFADGDWWATQMDPAAPGNAWENPLVQQAFDASLRARVLQVWSEKHLFFNALDRLPQAFCHNDFHRRNLLLRARPDGREEFVALDWAFCGPGAVGSDIGELVATSTYYFDSDPAQLDALAATVFDGYIAGLRDAGWDGDAQLARLGYLISATLWMGASLPGWAAFMLPEDSGINVRAMYGRPAQEVLTGWVTLTTFLMGYADEARHLMRKLAL